MKLLEHFHFNEKQTNGLKEKAQCPEVSKKICRLGKECFGSKHPGWELFTKGQYSAPYYLTRGSISDHSSFIFLL